MDVTILDFRFKCVITYSVMKLSKPTDIRMMSLRRVRFKSQVTSSICSYTLAGKSIAHISHADFADLMFWEREAE